MTQPYLDLLTNILEHGRSKGDRTGTGTKSIFGAQIRFDLRKGFPLLTTKRLPFRWIAEELLWMLSGSTNEHELREKGVDIWKEWATKEQCERFGRKEGDLGPVYGWQWRNFGGTEYWYEGEEPDGTTVPDGAAKRIDASDAVHRRESGGLDQIAAALELLETNPDSRRIIVTGWNPAEATKVALPPCHTLFQFETHEEMRPVSTDPEGHTEGHDYHESVRVLSCHMYQRSADVFLGVPFNIASYALLTHMVAHALQYRVGDLVISFGDVHIYNNHFEQVRAQLSRGPRTLPHLAIRYPWVPTPGSSPLDRLLDMKYEHFDLQGYDPHPKIAAEVSV